MTQTNNNPLSSPSSSNDIYQNVLEYFSIDIKNSKATRLMEQNKALKNDIDNIKEKISVQKKNLKFVQVTNVEIHNLEKLLKSKNNEIGKNNLELRNIYKSSIDDIDSKLVGGYYDSTNYIKVHNEHDKLKQKNDILQQELDSIKIKKDDVKDFLDTKFEEKKRQEILIINNDKIPNTKKEIHDLDKKKQNFQAQKTDIINEQNKLQYPTGADKTKYDLFHKEIIDLQAKIDQNSTEQVSKHQEIKSLKDKVLEIDHQISIRKENILRYKRPETNFEIIFDELEKDEKDKLQEKNKKHLDFATKDREFKLLQSQKQKHETISNDKYFDKLKAIRSNLNDEIIALNGNSYISRNDNPSVIRRTINKLKNIFN